MTDNSLDNGYPTIKNYIKGIIPYVYVPYPILSYYKNMTEYKTYGIIIVG